MPNDAKLGLVLGVGAVIAVAVTCFRKDLATSRITSDPAPAAVVGIGRGGAAPGGRSVAGKVTNAPRQDSGQRHIVQPGDTLAAIAEKYYGDSGKWNVIVEANRTTLAGSGELAAGMVLVIPDGQAETDSH